MKIFPYKPFPILAAVMRYLFLEVKELMKIVSTLTVVTTLLTLVGFVLSVSALRYDVGRAALTMWITATPLFIISPIAKIYASRQETRERSRQKTSLEGTTEDARHRSARPENRIGDPQAAEGVTQASH